MNYRSKIISLALLAGLSISNGLYGYTGATALLAALPAIPQVSLPKIDLGVGQRFDNISESLDWAAESVSHLTDHGAPAINGLSKSINTLVYEGIYKGIKSAGICATGVIAAACGLGIITHTVLNDNAKSKKTKYAIGAGFSALGIAAVMCSNWLSGMDK